MDGVRSQDQYGSILVRLKTRNYNCWPSSPVMVRVLSFLCTRSGQSRGQAKVEMQEWNEIEAKSQEHAADDGPPFIFSWHCQSVLCLLCCALHLLELFIGLFLFIDLILTLPRRPPGCRSPVAASACSTQLTVHSSQVTAPSSRIAIWVEEGKHKKEADKML